jgi:PPM family protein phosphatase
MTWHISFASDSSRMQSEDRVAVYPIPEGQIAVLADGMGGRSGGAAAADAVVMACETLAQLNLEPRTWMTWFRKLDEQMSVAPQIGETTALIVALLPQMIFGLSVGDSEAWWIEATESRHLSAGSEPKPWLGSGSAKPTQFTLTPNSGTLLLATDGLTKYCNREKWAGKLREDELPGLAENLIETVRYSSGRLPDDIAVLVARRSTS